jgi:hypothetical protein
MDKCTRAVIWADAKDSTILRVEMEKLGNTKITSNDIAQKGKEMHQKAADIFMEKDCAFLSWCSLYSDTATC